MYSLPLTLSCKDSKQIPASRRRYKTEIEVGEAVAADAATSEIVASVVHAVTGRDKPHWHIDVSNGDLGMPLPQLLRKVARLDLSAPASAVQLPGWNPAINGLELTATLRCLRSKGLAAGWPPQQQPRHQPCRQRQRQARR